MNVVLLFAKVRKIFDSARFFSGFYILFNAIYSFVSIIISNFVSKLNIGGLLLPPVTVKL